MNDLGQSAISEVCGRAGIDVADSMLGIGRELSYRQSLARTIVVHFDEAEFPNQIRRLLAAILGFETQWLLFSRHGELREKEFRKNEIPGILEFLIQRFPAVDREGDDIYLLAKSGKLFISFDHHLFDNGMPIFLADIPLAGSLLARLNELGAEIELFSKSG